MKLCWTQPIKSTLVLALMLVLSGLSGCMTIVDTKAVLATDLNQSSDEHIIKRPAARFRDKFFEAELAPYSITKVDIGRTIQKDRKKTGTSKEDHTLINFLSDQTFSPELKHFSHYEISNHTSFEFNLSLDGQLKTSATCGAHDVLSGKKQTGRIGSSKRSNTSSGEFSTWEKTYLLCLIEQDDTTWHLSLIKGNGELPMLRLTSADGVFESDLLDRRVTVYKKTDGTLETKETPYYRDEIAGFAFTQNFQQVGAVSLTGNNNRIWVKSNLPTKTKELLLTANYGVLLEEWITRL